LFNQKFSPEANDFLRSLHNEFANTPNKRMQRTAKPLRALSAADARRYATQFDSRGAF